MADAGLSTDASGDGELAHLIAAVCDGHATVADRDRLETLLAQPGARAEYIATLRGHAELLWRWHRDRPLRPGSRRLFVAAAGLAAACLPAIWLVGWPWGQERPQMISQAAAADSRFGDTSPAYARGDTLAVGDRIDLEAGFGELALPGAVTVVLEGPAQAEIRDLSSLVLDRGRLTATLNRRGSRLAIETPTAFITDRGIPSSASTLMRQAEPTCGCSRAASRWPPRQPPVTGAIGRVYFLVDDLLIVAGEFSQPTDGIRHVALSVFENTVATISDFRVEVCRPE